VVAPIARLLDVATATGDGNAACIGGVAFVATTGAGSGNISESTSLVATSGAVSINIGEPVGFSGSRSLSSESPFVVY
jgi:hypothetical protein